MESKTQVEIWLDFAIQQLAAESYLDGIDISSESMVRERLELGTNHYKYITQNRIDGMKDHASRMVDSQAETFYENYQIIHHLPNRSSGFSGTLIKNRDTGEFTLSMRSTEFREENKGGDKIRDAYGADGDISFNGFSLAQLASMEDYYEFLINQGHISADTELNLTSYSLSGHLATIFTEIHPEVVIKSYNFNAVGRGDFNVSAGTLENMIDDYRALILDPGVLVQPSFGSDTTLYDLWDLATKEPDSDIPEDVYYVNSLINLTEKQGELANVQYTARHDYAEQAILRKYATSLLLTGKELDSGISEKIDQIYGDAALSQNDFEIVANQGINSQNEFAILIEDQPNVDGILGSLAGKEFRFGDTHSIVLIIDSLSLTNVMQKIDPTLSRATAETIMINSSAAKADGALLGDGVSEHDTLDNVINNLGMLFFGDTFTTLDPSAISGEFGNITYRESFHDALTDIQAVAEDKNYKIIPSNLGDALVEGQQGIGYRYALVNLNPFVVTGFDYAQHNQNHEFDLYNLATGIGLTEDYLQSRALLLEAKNAVFSADLNADGAGKRELFSSALGDGIFHDFSSNLNIETNKRRKPTGQEIPPPVIPEKARYLFGSANDENEGELDGGSKADHVFAGGGDDTLIGNSGDDHLEGGQGTDTYIYTTGDGNDTIIDSDGLGNVNWNGNVLSVVTLNESNSFNDNDKGIAYYFEPDHVDGAVGTLKIVDTSNPTKSSITIKYYTLGDLGLTSPQTAAEVSDTATNASYIGDNNSNFSHNYSAYDGKNAELIGLEGEDYLRGFSGDDILIGGTGNDWLIGDTDNDWLQGGNGNDVLLLGDGQDSAFGGEGNDFISANSFLYPYIEFDSNDNDVHLTQQQQWKIIQSTYVVTQGTNIILSYPSEGFSGVLDDNPDISYAYTPNNGLYGKGSLALFSISTGKTGLYHLSTTSVPFTDTNSNTLYGEAGEDVLIGNDGPDWLHGGAGNDALYGNAGNDTLVGGSGNDRIFGAEGDDRLEGGDGVDNILGHSGDDRLFGGKGNDFLWGDSDALDSSLHGNDYIEGGDGNDEARGGSGADIIYGGQGADKLFGQKGNDKLYGGLNNDYLYGNEGDDYLEGNEGYDRLYGHEGNDTLRGGSGNNDYLAGNDGDDIYLFTAGDGNTTINNFDNSRTSQDILRFMAGIRPVDVLIKRTNNDLKLTLQSTGKVITVQSYFSSLNYELYAIEFSDGTSWDGDFVRAQALIPSDSNDTLYGYASDDTINGLDGHDSIYGEAGNDVLTGGNGDDRLQGGDGNDLLLGGMGNDSLKGQNGNDTLDGGGNANYLFGGNGNDTYLFALNAADYTGINNYDSDGGYDVLRFGESIAPSDVVATRTSVNKELSVDLMLWKSDQLIFLADYLSSNSSLDVIEFSDGTNWGYQTVIDMIKQHSLGADYLYSSDAVNNYLSGATGNDYLSINTEGDFYLLGGEGDDFLIGGTGNDIFYGGSGYDEILGTAGENTYRFGLGDGVDLIRSYPSSVLQTVEFGSDVFPGDVSVHIDSGNLILNLEGTTDQLIIQDFIYLEPSYQFKFSDSTIWDSVDILQWLRVTDDMDNVIRGDDTNDVIDGQAGSDRLIGQAGDDTLIGGEGDDELYGHGTSYLSDGNDTLIGGLGYDTLYGDKGDDAFFGGAGDDQLNDRYGNDTYHYHIGDGSDTIHDQNGVDTLVFGEGIQPSELSLHQLYDDLLIHFSNSGDEITVINYFHTGQQSSLENITFSDSTIWDFNYVSSIVNIIDYVRQVGSSNADNLIGDANYDNLQGEAGNDTLEGRGGNDVLKGGDGDDVLFGGNGKDTLFGGNGDDVLNGAAGDDYMEGGSGSNTYIVGPNNGRDKINQLSRNIIDGQDTLKFVEGITADDIKLTALRTSLFLKIKGSDDSVELKGFFADHSLYSKTHAIGTVHFGDGTTWDLDFLKSVGTLETEGDDWIIGNSFSNTLNGLAGHDVIAGRVGDDVLMGGIGDDMLYSGEGNDFLYGGRGNDSLFAYVSSELSFGGNSLAATGQKEMFGGQGDDDLFGGLGTTIFHFQSGDGRDRIFNPSSRDVDTTNILQLGVGIAASDLLIQRADTEKSNLIDDLLITIKSSGDQIRVVNHFAQEDYSGNYVLTTLRFNDGTEWDVDTIHSEIWTPKELDNRLYGDNENNNLVGENGNNYLSGRAGNDTLKGSTGDDWLYGDNGDDYLHGGKGADYLVGGEGNDTYKFELGDGHDQIMNHNWSGADVLQFGVAITPENVELFKANEDLLIVIGDTGEDRIRVGNYFSTQYGKGADALDRIIFSSGTEWTFDYVQSNLSDLDKLGGNKTNNAPIVNTALLDQASDEDVLFRYQVLAGSFIDNDAGDTLTYIATLADNSELPSWLSFDADTKILSGTPDNEDVNVLDIKITAIDNDGLSVSDSFVLTINNINDGPIVTTGLADQTGDENTLFSYQLPMDTFTDSDIGDTLTLSASLVDGSILPDWLSFDINTQIFSGLPPLDGSGAYDIKITATDTGGLAAETIFNLIVDDANPDIIGGTGNDTLLGTKYDDVINSGEGDDILIGGAGDDTLLGGKGSDWLQGGSGDDVLLMSEDAIWSNRFFAKNVGSPGHRGSRERIRLINKQNSHDLFDGGEGQDILQGTDGDDVIFLEDTFSPLPNSTTGPRVVDIERFDMGNGNDVVDLTSKKHSYADVTLNGEAGNDVLWGSSGNDILSGGEGNDQLTGGAGSDTYLFDRGDGQDVIRNYDPVKSSRDVLAFGDAINEQQLWFERAGNDLEISIMGTEDNVMMKNWYRHERHQLDEISVSNGHTLSNNQVDQLVQAMAVFNPSSSAELELSGQIKEELAPVITASWQA